MDAFGRNELAKGIDLAKRSEATVLITGETGTGKSTLAEAIHRAGSRAERPFVTVNLASLHEATIESALFGHERGAFTGADRMRTGRLEQADGGTLFLDEIAELSLPLQSRLLEFLQRKTVTPLGGCVERKLDVRVICATNRNLEQSVREGRFREDLHHRIRVLHLRLASLGDRTGEDFSRSVHEALESACARAGKTLHRMTKEVAELFECYPWPGNFRELENVLEIATLASNEAVLDVADLPSWFVEAARASPAFRLNAEVLIRAEARGRGVVATADVPLARNYRKTLRRFETAVLRHFLDRHDGNFARAARETGLSRATFYRKAIQCGLLADGALR